jgi:hypothetical protein
VIIYALHEYLVNALTNLISFEQIIVAGAEIGDAEEAIYLRDLGGSTRGWPDNRSDAIIQCVAQARDDYRARELSNYVFSVYREIFKQSFTFETMSYFVQRIGAVQRPTPMGTSETGLYQYANNYEVVFSEQINTVEELTI